MAASSVPPAGAAVSGNTIEVRVQRLDALFETLDPSPFREKALDREFETYLLDCAGEFPDARPLTLLVHAPPPLREHVGDLGAAIRAHFAFLLEQHGRRGRLLTRRHRGIVLAGVGVLAMALLLRRLLHGWGGGAEIVAEGLLVLGWVALWRPIEALLFDRQAAREARGLLQRLASAEVEWRDAPSATPRGDG